MKTILYLLLILNCCQLHAQRVDVFSGINLNKYYDTQDYIFGSDYSNELGYNLGIGVELNDLSWLRIALNYTNYSGGLRVSEGGQAGRNTTQGTIRKSLLSVEIYPIRLEGGLDLNIGFAVSTLINHRTNATSSGFFMGQPFVSWNEAINERYEKFNSSVYFGLIGKLSYRFVISDQLELVPYYSYYIGLSNEFLEFPESTKAMRHNIGIGLSKALKN